MSCYVAREEFGIGGGYLLALGNVDCGTHDHIVGLLLEGVIRVGNAIVIHDSKQGIECAIAELLVVGGAICCLIKAIRPEHGNGAIHDLHQLLVGGKVLKAFSGIAHLGAMIVIQIRLQAIDQIALIFGQIDGTRHTQQTYYHGIGHIRLVGTPRFEHIAVALMLFLFGAQTADGQAAALAAHEACIGQHFQADAARIQRVLLLGGQAN